MLSQILYYKTEDVGKTSAVSVHPTKPTILWHFPQPFLAKSPQNQKIYIIADLVSKSVQESNRLKEL
jgi:hypothetical protein